MDRHTQSVTLLDRYDSRQAPAVYQNPQAYALPIDMPRRNEQAHVLDYWRVIVKRKWLILLCFVVTLATVFIANAKMSPVYKAAATIQIDTDQVNVLPYKEVVEANSYAAQAEYIQTQYKILQSKTLANRVIKVLRLESNAALIDQKEAADARKRGEDSPALTTFQKNLEVEPVRNSQLVTISFKSRDPNLAKEVINTLSNEYIQQNFESRYQATQQATEFLKKQLTQLKSKLEQSEESLARYARDNGIMVVSQQQEQQEVGLQTLTDLNKALTDARAERIQKESIHNILKALPDPVANFPSSLRNPLIEDLEKKLAQLRQEYAKLASKLRPEHPSVKEVQEQINETAGQLKSERQAAIRNTLTEYDTASRREKLLSDAVNSQKGQANKVKESLIQYNILQREVDTNKNIYEGMLTRLKEASVAAGLRSSNIRVVDKADLPTIPDSPKKGLNLLLGSVVGIMLGFGLAFFVEYLDSTVKTPEEVEQLTNLPALGLIPSARSAERPGLAAQSTGKVRSLVRVTQQDEPNLDLIAHEEPTSSMAEAFRSLRTSILLSNSDKPPHTFVFTSSRPQEGKTTASINTAISFAQTGKRVALIDLDLRKPRVHKAFNIENTAGMSSFLAGTSDLSPLIHQTQVENLFVIPSGPIPPNPAELLTSKRLGQALELLREYFDQIIIDSPPVLSVTDSRILARLTDGVVLIVRSGDTPRPVVLETLRNLQLINARILGVLINDADLQSADYYYHYSHYYYAYSEGDTRSGRKRRRSAS